MTPIRPDIRHHLRPGDIGDIIALHGRAYAAEFGFDITFEAYVARPLAQCVQRRSPRDRIWVAEHGGAIAGCVAIVEASPTEAQLRWFLVAPAARGGGLGRRLLREAIDFAAAAGYKSVFLWTVSQLTVAAALYRDAGFVKVEGKPSRQWGVDVVEERYVLDLARPSGSGAGRE